MHFDQLNRREFITLLGGASASAGAAVTTNTSTPANYPHLLDGYAVRPPWQVAGVDFYVGCPTNITLRPANDGSIDAMPGFTWRQNGQIRFDGVNDLIFDGYDFSVDGGYWFYLNNCNNFTFTNCLFAGAATYRHLPIAIIQHSGTSSGFTLKNCTIDGGATAVGTSTTRDGMLVVAAPVTLQYNWFKGSYGQFLSTGSTGTAAVVVQYNFFDEAYVGIDTGQIIHMNYMQWSSGGTATPTWTFNTTRQSVAYQPTPGTWAVGEGPQFYFNSGGTMNSPNCSYNTMIALQPAGSGSVSMSNMIHGSVIGGTTLTGSPVLSNNYMDFSGAYGPFYAGSFVGWAVSGNVDMKTGNIITTPSRQDGCVLTMGSQYQLKSDTVDWTMQISSGQSCVRGLRHKRVTIDTAKLVSPPKSGQLRLLGSGFSYTAKSDFQGQDSFTIQVSGMLNGIPGSSDIRIIASVGPK